MAEDALDQPSELEFAEKQPGHDGFASAGIIRQEETHLGQFEQIVVDGFELMGQRVHPRDRQPKIRIKLVGNTQRIGLQPQPQQLSIAVVGCGCILHCERFEVLGRKSHTPEAFRVETNQSHSPGVRTSGTDGLDPYRFTKKHARENMARPNNPFAHGSLPRLRLRSLYLKNPTLTASLSHSPGQTVDSWLSPDKTLENHNSRTTCPRVGKEPSRILVFLLCDTPF
jgi:hypothetical protein